MASQQGSDNSRTEPSPKRKNRILDHDEPGHTHLGVSCTFDNCHPCECDDAKQAQAEHCQHCWHCQHCSSAVARGCRICASSPDRSKYLSYIGGLRQDGSWGDGTGVEVKYCARHKDGEEEDVSVDCSCPGFPGATSLDPYL